MEDDGPYQAQSQLGVSVSDVVVSDVHQFDLTKTRQHSEEFERVPGFRGASGLLLPAGASGSPVLSVHSVVCGIACVPFLWAEKEGGGEIKSCYLCMT